MTMPEREETVLGSVRGYRCWVTVADGVTLRAVTTRIPLSTRTWIWGEGWQGTGFKLDGDRQIFQAICTKDNTHKAPDVTCRCGFYATYFGGVNHLLQMTMAALPMGVFPHQAQPHSPLLTDFYELASRCVCPECRPGLMQLIMGTVQFSGRVVYGQTGVMRGEKMEIEALASVDVFGRDVGHQVLDKVSRAYNVPWFLGGITEFQNQYPLEPQRLGMTI